MLSSSSTLRRRRVLSRAWLKLPMPSSKHTRRAFLSTTGVVISTKCGKNHVLSARMRRIAARVKQESIRYTPSKTFPAPWSGSGTRVVSLQDSSNLRTILARTTSPANQWWDAAQSSAPITNSSASCWTSAQLANQVSSARNSLSSRGSML